MLGIGDRKEGGRDRSSSSPKLRLQHLRYVLAAADSGSFRQAALALGVQESAIRRSVEAFASWRKKLGSFFLNETKCAYINGNVYSSSSAILRSSSAYRTRASTASRMNLARCFCPTSASIRESKLSGNRTFVAFMSSDGRPMGRF